MLHPQAEEEEGGYGSGSSRVMIPGLRRVDACVGTRDRSSHAGVDAPALGASVEWRRSQM